MSGTLLTASMIVKNEEKYLGACLHSLRGIVDEIVILDTGSTDGTKGIAKDAGARVYDFPWTGDFSAARNRALELSSGQWILYIDADEQIRPESAFHLREHLASPSQASALGWEVLLHPIRGFSPYWILRIFRNDPAVRFQGVIHENIWPALTDYQSKHGGAVGRYKLVLDHDGYQDNHAAKDARNLPLLIKYLKDDPSRVFCWCQLGDIYTSRGEHDLAENAWRQGLDWVRRRPTGVPENVVPYIKLIERGVADVHPLLTEALLKFPWSPHLQAIYGHILIREDQPEKAIPIFEALISSGKSGEYDHGAAYDLRLFGVYAFEAIASCYFRLGRYSESRYYSRLAAEAEPEKLVYKVRQALCSRLERQSQSMAAL